MSFKKEILQLSRHLCKVYPLLEWDSNIKSWICAPKKTVCGYTENPTGVDSTKGMNIISMKNMPADSCFRCPIRPTVQEGQEYLIFVLATFSPGDIQREGAIKMWPLTSILSEES